MLEFLKRPLAITDIETTGFDADLHEIIEIGLVVADQPGLEIREEWLVKVRPRRIKTAAVQALKINGYNKLDWLRAVSLSEAMETYSRKTKGAIFLAHNSFFDWSFMTAAFKSTGVEDHTDYHRLDLFSLAWARNRIRPLRGLAKFSLSELCKHFGLEPEPKPHRALSGARKALEVLKKLERI